MRKKNQYRIGIDARFYGLQQKGLGRYTQKLIENLEKIDKVNRYFIFLRKENFNQYHPKNPNFKKVLANYKWYTVSEQIFIPLKIWQQKLDLMHFPHFNVPLFYKPLFIVTIHDLVLKEFPTKRATTLNPIIYKIKAKGYEIVIKNATKTAKKIIVPSNFIKEEVLKYFEVEPEKIKVIYEGAPKKYQRLDSRCQMEMFKKYKINRPYLLYVGNAYPHKNLENLIEGFNLLRKQGLDYQLVLVGKEDYFYQRLKELLATRYPLLTDKVIFTGFFPDSDLRYLYQNSSLYVFPSLSEGFGLPSLEAMAQGVPVLSSNIPVLQEILKDSALFFNPRDPRDIASKIKLVLENKKTQESLIQKGFSQIKKYNWQKMAEETLNIYQGVLS